MKTILSTIILLLLALAASAADINITNIVLSSGLSTNDTFLALTNGTHTARPRIQDIIDLAKQQIKGSNAANISPWPYNIDAANYDLSHAGTITSCNVWDQANLKWWGAKGDGIANDTAPAQAWLDSITNHGGHLFAPEGVYRVGSLHYGTSVPWQSETNGTIIQGAGQFATTLVITSNNVIGLNVIGQRRFDLSGLSIITADGVTAQCALLVARETNSGQSMYNNVHDLSIWGHFSKANIVHMGAEVCTYDHLSLNNFEPHPTFYAARGNSDLGLTNNFLTIWENDTTGNIIQNSFLQNGTNGGCCIEFYDNVAFTVMDTFFATDYLLPFTATNACFRLKCFPDSGFSHFTGRIVCLNNTYEGVYARPYYLDNNNTNQSALYWGLSEHGGKFNITGWASNPTNQLLASSQSAYVWLQGCDIKLGENPLGSTETFRLVQDSTLDFSSSVASVGSSPSKVNVIYGTIDSTIKAAVVSPGAASSNSEIVTSTNRSWDGLVVYSGPTNAMRVKVTAPANGVGLVVGTYALGETNDIVQVQDSFGNVLDRFDANGKLGVGTYDPPSEVLSVHNPYYPLGSVNPIVISQKAGLTTVLGGMYSTTEATNQASAGLEFKVFKYNFGLTDAVRIDNAGNVGIGTNAPGFLLDVAGPVNATGYYLNGVPFTNSFSGTNDLSYYWTTSQVTTAISEALNNIININADTLTITDAFYTGITNAALVGTDGNGRLVRTNLSSDVPLKSAVNTFSNNNEFQSGVQFDSTVTASNSVFIGVKANVGSTGAVGGTNQFEIHAPGGTLRYGTNGVLYGDGSGLSLNATNLFGTVDSARLSIDGSTITTNSYGQLQASGSGGTNSLTTISTNGVTALYGVFTNLNFVDGTNIHFSATSSGQTVTIKADWIRSNLYPTNQWSGLIENGWSGVSSSGDIGITSFTLASASQTIVQWEEVMIKNLIGPTPIQIIMDPATTLTGGTGHYWVTNQAILHVVYYPGLGTNAWLSVPGLPP